MLESVKMGESEQMLKHLPDPIQRPVRRSPVPDQDSTTLVEWRLLADFEGRVEVSIDGRVKSNGKILSGSFDRYAFVRIKASGKYRKSYVHRLVAQAFIEKRHGCDHVNHIDGNKKNNSASNLEWVTQAENNRHAYRNKLISSGSGHHWARLTESDVSEIRAAKGKVAQAELARRFGISQSNISAIQRGASWNTKERCASVR